MDGSEDTEKDSSSDNDIYDIVIECSNLVENLISFINDDHTGGESESVSHLQSSENDATTSNKIKRLGRSFDQWISYTGALASIDRSLDNRLRGHIDIKEMVMDLLEVFQRNLSHISSSNDSEPSVERLELEEEAWKAAEKSLEDLHFMAAAIRRASTQSQKYALSSQFEQNEEIYFENCATILAKRNFPNGRRSLCEHLGVSVAVRRQNIFRRRMHEEKLSKRREITTLATKPRLNESYSAAKLPQIHHRPQSAIQLLMLRTLEKKHSVRSGSHDSRSELQSTVARKYLKHGPSLSTISTGSSIHTGTIGYPPKPKPLPDDKYCACPYCAKPLDSERLEKDTLYWESHVDLDTQPYVCLSEDCNSPFLFFANMNQWLNHMDTIHSEEWNRKIHMRTWYCNVGHGSQTYQFNNHADFVTHMKDENNHPGRNSPTTSQIESLSRRMQKMLTRKDLYVCPLCDCVPAAITPIVNTSSHEDIRRQLGKHIAQHVKFFTFVSIPIFTDEEDEGKTSATSESGHETWRHVKEGSKASYQFDFGDLQEEILYDFGEDLYSQGEKPFLGRAETYPDTHESLWSEMGLENYRHLPIVSTAERPDPILEHFSLMQLAKFPEPAESQNKKFNTFNDLEQSPEDKIAMQKGAAEVRKVLAAEADKVTIARIQESLWYYYYDIRRTVAYLTKSFIKSTLVPELKKAPKDTKESNMECSDEGGSEMESFERHHPWLESSRKLRTNISSLNNEAAGVNSTKIAIISDSLDLGWRTFKNTYEKVEAIRSFYSFQGGHHFDYQLHSTAGTLNQGSLVAALVCTMCPKVKLYICRVEETVSSTRSRSMRMESAARAVEWAIEQEVDVIYMAWTFKQSIQDADVQTHFNKALAEADSRGIIIMSSVNDEGGNLVKTRPEESEMCIRIGASTPTSDKASFISPRDADFFFPGEEIPLAIVKDYLPVESTLSNNDVAAAIAAGTAGLLLYLQRLSEKCGEKGCRIPLVGRLAMAEMFRKMSTEGNKCPNLEMFNVSDETTFNRNLEESCAQLGAILHNLRTRQAVNSSVRFS